MPTYIPTAAFKIKASLFYYTDLNDVVKKWERPPGNRTPGGVIYFARKEDLDLYRFSFSLPDESKVLISKRHSILIRGVSSFAELSFDGTDPPCQDAGLSGIYKIERLVAMTGGPYYEVGLIESA